MPSTALKLLLLIVATVVTYMHTKTKLGPTERMRALTIHAQSDCKSGKDMLKFLKKILNHHNSLVSPLKICHDFALNTDAFSSKCDSQESSNCAILPSLCGHAQGHASRKRRVPSMNGVRCVSLEI